MSAMVDGNLAAFAAELNAAFEALLDKHMSKIDAHAPFGLELTTVDGVAARYLEEGIEFYPQDDEKEK